VSTTSSNITPPLDLFVSRIAFLLPADFAPAVRALDLGAARPQPFSLPVCRFWDKLVAGEDPLLAPLAKLGPALRWVQNPNYVAAPPSPEFLASYGYAVLAGPGGLVASCDLALGILILGPGIHYPSHNHPAVEIYVVLAGEAEWQKGEEPWRREKPGTVIRHDSMVSHAMRALGEPLLAAYVWRGDLATHAQLTESPIIPESKKRQP
jgi:hypothetical protein